MREVYKAVIYINPLEPMTMVNGIKEILTNENTRKNYYSTVKGFWSPDEKEFNQFFEIMKRRNIINTWEFKLDDCKKVLKFIFPIFVMNFSKFLKIIQK